MSYDREDVLDIARIGVDLDLGADLPDRDEVLVAQSIDDESGAHCVRRQEDGVAVDQAFSSIMIHNIRFDGVESNVGRSLQSQPFGNDNLAGGWPPEPTREHARKPPEAEIPRYGSDESRVVRFIDAVVVNGDDMANAKAGEIFVDERSDPSEANDADSLHGEDVLTTVSKEPDLAVVALVGTRRPLQFGE